MAGLSLSLWRCYPDNFVNGYFGAMAKDSYLEISSHFGIYPLEQSIALRRDKFLKKYSSSDNYLCRLIAKR